MTNKKLLISGMSCQHCVMELRQQLSMLNMIIKDVQIGSAEIEYDEEKISHEQIEFAVKKAGFVLKN
jgi:copper chaperone CopZ